MRALVVFWVAFLCELFLNSPLFPWPRLAETLPQSSPIELLIFGGTVLVFAAAREYKISGDRSIRWNVTQVVCGLIIARGIFVALVQWLLQQD